MEVLPRHNEPLAGPTHVAIIMDGNGRWATSRGLPRTAGHRRGMESVRETVKGALELGIGYLTLYGFSSENWSRPEAEVRDLMGLLRFYLRREISDLSRQGVRVRFIGDRERLSDDLVRLIEESEARTQHNVRMNLIIALSYGGRGEIVQAAKRIAERAAAGEISIDAIDERLLSGCLLTHDVPDPDLVIRTSGEQRLSNFLLWQSAYSELVFVPCLWPDFDRAQLNDAILEFRRRERRYGAVAG